MIIDSHVHFWDPGALQYPWLAGIPALDRPFLPADYAAGGTATVAQIVVVEANCAAAQGVDEVAYIERLAAVDARIDAIVAFAPVGEPERLDRTLDMVSTSPRVKGVRQNIQGQAAGFCLQPAFVHGVRTLGRRNLTFDICITHDQLSDAIHLVRACPDTRFVLDHCAKPAIRTRAFEPWSTQIAELAACDNVWCKLSGLLTEAAPDPWCDDDLIPYAARVVECFGTERVMFGSDWPVVTASATYADWYEFTRRFTSGWSASEVGRFYFGTASRFYRLNRPSAGNHELTAEGAEDGREQLSEPQRARRDAENS